MQRFAKLAASFALAAAVAGCTGTAMKTQNLDPSQYTVVGHGEGKATGLMILGFIPVQQNDRFVRAQQAAIKSRGGDALINAQVQENWFWAYVLSGFTTTVSGDVVKLKH
ncbi:hypothetical protein BGI51_10750 [Pseudomonas oryzihabitans]|uniref:hypothetical protein n=1 Tax=Pseudomonas oryzihabitans TaxID=47885 RepID=UPI00165E7E37|nr:hypothetical protein [Pseudomonas psychrotolerans]QNQ98122.1 hypothetical protein BGI51_10750 [Pseudomonas psychrotolerans]